MFVGATMTVVYVVVGLLVLQRLAELAYAARNQAIALARGGKEHGRNHYWMFVVLHSLWLAGMLTESRSTDGVLPPWFWFCIVMALLLQGGRYVVIRTLGEAWNTRIITWPGMTIVRSGLFRYVKHPNYVIVSLELAIIPLAFGCWRTALAASIVNAYILLFVRIPAEEKALREAGMGQPLP
jgi:methyltransferase